MTWDTQILINAFENINGKNHYYEKKFKIQQMQVKLPRSTNVSLLQDAHERTKVQQVGRSSSNNSIQGLKQV
jgi:hypothetical protein